MARPQAQLVFTEEEYLEFERNSDVRHEYLDGHLLLMAGESDERGDISMNLAVLIGGQLRGKPCRARSRCAAALCRAPRTTPKDFTLTLTWS